MQPSDFEIMRIRVKRAGVGGRKGGEGCKRQKPGCMFGQRRAAERSRIWVGSWENPVNINRVRMSLEGRGEVGGMVCSRITFVDATFPTCSIPLWHCAGFHDVWFCNGEQEGSLTAPLWRLSDTTYIKNSGIMIIIIIPTKMLSKPWTSPICQIL